MNFKLAVLPLPAFYYPMNNTMTEKLKTSFATTGNSNLMYRIYVTKGSFREEPSRGKMKYIIISLCSVCIILRRLFSSNLSKNSTSKGDTSRRCSN